VVPITFRLIIPLTWCHRRSITSSGTANKWVVIIINILRSSRISIKFMMGNTILAPRGLCYHRQHSCLPPTQTCSCYGCNLLSSLYDVLPWSINVFYDKDIVRIAPPLKNSWYSDTSHHHHSFLVLVLIPTGVPTSERCCLDSAFLAKYFSFSTNASGVHWPFLRIFINPTLVLKLLETFNSETFQCILLFLGQSPPPLTLTDLLYLWF